MVKNPLANAGDVRDSEDVRDSGSIPGSGRSPGGEKGHPLQYSCWENPMDRGAGRVIAHRVAESEKSETTDHARLPKLTYS